MKEKILLELKYYGKLRIGNDIKDQAIGIATFLILLSAIIIIWINEKYLSSHLDILSIITILGIICVSLALPIINIICKRQIFLQITEEAIVLLNHKYQAYQTYQFEDIFWINYRNFKIEDGTINQLIIIHKGKEEYIELNKFNEAIISKIIKHLEKSGFEIPLINR